MSKVARPKEHTLGEVRYLTHYVIFPDGDTWCDQLHFFGPLSTWLKLTNYRHNSAICTDLLRRGETRWKAADGPIHRLVVENIKRERIWGVQRRKGLLS